MKKLLSILFLLSSLLSAYAQMFREDGWNYYFDYDHRVVVRSCIACTEDYQDLWNGDIVRLIGDYVYIYYNGSLITQGNRVWLEHTGHYTVERGSWQYLVDANGNMTGVSGKVVDILWNGVARVKRGDYYYLYTLDGSRLGTILSDEPIDVYWDGTYVFHQGGYYYLADESGDRVGGSYSETEPTIMSSGNWRVTRSGRTYMITSSGTIVY